jgi:hypothetical protein
MLPLCLAIYFVLVLLRGILLLTGTLINYIRAELNGTELSLHLDVSFYLLM